MAKQTKKQPWKDWHGFAVELKPDTDLRGGILIAEYEGGAYEPIAAVTRRAVPHSSLNRGGKASANAGFGRVARQRIAVEFMPVPG